MLETNESVRAATAELDAWLAECLLYEPQPQLPFQYCPVKVEAFRETLRAKDPHLTEGDIAEAISQFLWMPESASFLAADYGMNG